MSTPTAKIHDAKHWSWVLKRDIVKFKELMAEAMTQFPTSDGWTIQQERFFSEQSSQEHALLTHAWNFFKASKLIGAPINEALQEKTLHLRNIHEHWEDNRKFFTGDQPDFSKARESTRWFRTNFPTETPFSRGYSNARGYDIGGILNPDELLKQIAVTENVVRQKIEEQK
jgi:hypothetical protein